jgi:hypothetical protein
MRIRMLLFVPLLVSVVGCDRSNLKDPSLLTELRLLALVADTPEVAPGTVVNVTPFVSDVNGGGRALTYSVEACVDPGLAVGVRPSCTGRPDRVVIATDVPLPLAGPNYTGNAPTFAVTVPANVLDNRPPTVQANGLAYLVFYAVRAADGAAVRGFKRVFASTRPVKNQNPVITTVTAGGAALAGLPSASTTLRVDVPAVSKETFTQLNVDGSTIQRTEDPLVSWFVTDGELDPTRSAVDDSVEWTPPTTVPTGRNVLLVAVVRDRRGGDAVFSYAFP